MTRPGGSAPHITQTGADVDWCPRSRRHHIGGAAVWCGVAAGEKPEDLIRQEARARRDHVAAALAGLVRQVETERLQQMKMLAYPGHRHIEEPVLLVDLLGLSLGPSEGIQPSTNRENSPDA